MGRLTHFIENLQRNTQTLKAILSASYLSLSNSEAMNMLKAPNRNTLILKRAGCGTKVVVNVKNNNDRR